MKCYKCGGNEFALESTIIVTEKYKIYKNGRVSDHPINREVNNQDMTDNENIVRCKGCNSGFVIPGKNRNELLYKTDFSKVNLNTEVMETEF